MYGSQAFVSHNSRLRDLTGLVSTAIKKKTQTVGPPTLHVRFSVGDRFCQVKISSGL